VHVVDKATIVVTGASDGIGAAAARLLHAAGASVVIVGRSLTKTEKIAGELNVPHYVADFSNLDEVRTLASRLNADLSRIDVLANNAGGIMGSRILTVDGNELTFQVNHLAPFLLTNLLLEKLKASKATVIATSSIANRRPGRLNLDDVNLDHGYSAGSAYSKAKLMNILFTKELHRRHRTDGIAAAAFHPGVVRTSFSAEFGGAFSVGYTSVLRRLLRSPEKGAETLVWLATSTPGRDWLSGEFYKDKQVSRANRQAYDPTLAKELWDRSVEMAGL
jgi:NAD(P)-dependent dehydrogenase (short-subunit alcohol dehydrogenase family)